MAAKKLLLLLNVLNLFSENQNFVCLLFNCLFIYDRIHYFTLCVIILQNSDIHIIYRMSRSVVGKREVSQRVK
jgi:hypothetical protein